MEHIPSDLNQQELISWVSEGISDSHERPSFFIGPELHLYFSGLTTSVRDELELFVPADQMEAVISILVNHDLTKTLNQNPLSLSGGEQSKIVLITRFAAQPRRVALFECLGHIYSEQRESFVSECKSLVKQSLELRISQSEANLSDRRDESQSESSTDVSAFVGVREHYSQFAPDELVIEDLSYAFPGSNRTLFQDISHVFDSGRCHFIIGKNGGGKSTLGRLLSGALKADSGNVFRQNGNLRSRTIHDLRRSVYYSSQNPDEQFFSSSFSSEVLSSSSLDPKVATSTTNTLLKQFMLDGFLTHHPLDIDIDFRVRKILSIACALLSGRQWIVLDEPTLGLHPKEKKLLVSWISKLVEAGAGLIIISHSKWLTSVIKGQILDIESLESTI